MKFKNHRTLCVLLTLCSFGCDKKQGETHIGARGSTVSEAKEPVSCVSDWQDASRSYCVAALLAFYHNPHADELLVDWRRAADRLTATCTSANDWLAVGSSATAEAARRTPTTPQSIIDYCSDGVDHASAGLPPSTVRGDSGGAPAHTPVGSESSSTSGEQTIVRPSTSGPMAANVSPSPMPANAATAPIVRGTKERCEDAKANLNYDDMMSDVRSVILSPNEDKKEWKRRISNAGLEVSSIISEYRKIVGNDFAASDTKSPDIAEKCEADAALGRSKIEEVLNPLIGDSAD